MINFHSACELPERHPIHHQPECRPNDLNAAHFLLFLPMAMKQRFDEQWPNFIFKKCLLLSLVILPIGAIGHQHDGTKEPQQTTAKSRINFCLMQTTLNGLTLSVTGTGDHHHKDSCYSPLNSRQNRCEEIWHTTGFATIFLDSSSFRHKLRDALSHRQQARTKTQNLDAHDHRHYQIRWATNSVVMTISVLSRSFLASRSIIKADNA